MNYDELKKYIDNKTPIRQIARETGKSFTSIRYWMKKLGFFYTSDDVTQRYNELPRAIYTREELVAATTNINSYADIFRNLNIKINGGSYRWLKKLLEKFEISVYFTGNRENRNLTIAGNRATLRRIASLYENIDDLSNGERRSTKTLRVFMLFKGREEKCEICELIEWNGSKIRLDIHHIDGNCHNNHLNNLQFICPNCHRQETIPYTSTPLFTQTF